MAFKHHDKKLYFYRMMIGTIACRKMFVRSACACDSDRSDHHATNIGSNSTI